MSYNIIHGGGSGMGKWDADCMQEKAAFELAGLDVILTEKSMLCANRGVSFSCRDGIFTMSIVFPARERETDREEPVAA